MKEGREREGRKEGIQKGCKKEKEGRRNLNRKEKEQPAKEGRQAAR